MLVPRGFGALKLYARLAQPHPESVRKILHAGSGLLTLSFPFLFNDLWPVLLLTGATAILIAALKFAWWHRRLGRVVNDVKRTTLGEIYFPIAVAIVFWLACGQSPLYRIPMLVLTLADATGALIGLRYGQIHFVGAAQGVRRLTRVRRRRFLLCSCRCSVWSDIGRVETLLIAVTLALLVMLLEGRPGGVSTTCSCRSAGISCCRGLSCRCQPGACRQFDWWSRSASCSRSSSRAVRRHWSTIRCCGVFLCYVTWAVAGWRWLVPPLILFVGYAGSRRARRRTAPRFIASRRSCRLG